MLGSVNLPLAVASVTVCTGLLLVLLDWSFLQLVGIIQVLVKWHENHSQEKPRRSIICRLCNVHNNGSGRFLKIKSVLLPLM